jgi:hypothetical protein
MRGFPKYPLGDLNPCFRTENPTSWAGLDEGGVRSSLWYRSVSVGQRFQGEKPLSHLGTCGLVVAFWTKDYDAGGPYRGSDWR